MRTFATEVLVEERLDGDVIQLADNGLTVDEIPVETGRVSRKEVNVVYMNNEERKESKGKSALVASQNWQRLNGSKVDVKRMRSYGKKIETFREYFEVPKNRLVAAIR